jgi:16S rRNA processing protein RimM
LPVKFSSAKIDTTEVGKVLEPRGLRGELKVHIFSGEAHWASKVKEVHLEIRGEMKSFPVDSARVTPHGLILKLRGLDDRTAAEKVKGAKVFVQSDFFQSKKGEKIFLKEILGFTVITVEDDNQTLLGTIRSFESNGPQDLIVVEGARGEFLIPLVKDFIVKINHKDKTVLMSRPQGLLEVNS